MTQAVTIIDDGNLEVFVILVWNRINLYDESVRSDGVVDDVRQRAVERVADVAKAFDKDGGIWFEGVLYGV